MSVAANQDQSQHSQPEETELRLQNQFARQLEAASLDQSAQSEEANSVDLYQLARLIVGLMKEELRIDLERKGF